MTQVCSERDAMRVAKGKRKSVEVLNAAAQAAAQAQAQALGTQD